MQYTLVVDESQANLIGEGLSELSYKRSAPLIAVLRQQIGAQEKAAAEAKQAAEVRRLELEDAAKKAAEEAAKKETPDA